MQNNYNIRLFQELDESFLSQIDRHAKMVHLKKGELPFFHDDLLENFYIIVEGKLKSYQMNLETLKEQTLFIYRRGDMLDTIILLDSKPHEVLYKALENTHALQLPIEKVREWIDTDTHFKEKFFPYLATQMRHTEELAADLSLHDTATRFKKLLLENDNPKNRFTYSLLQNLSNTEIANLTGTVRHVIERHLKELKEEKIVSTSKKNISITDKNKLLD
jgi:CRP-like cAMP-binding protein